MCSVACWNTYTARRKALLASSLSFPTVPLLFLQGHRDVIRRISSSRAVHSESLQLFLDHKLIIRHAVCSRRSENWLFVYSRSLPMRWSWLQPSASSVVELWCLSQQPPSRLVSIAASLPFDSTASFAAIALASSAASYC